MKDHAKIRVALTKKRPVTPWEQRVLDIVLTELRRGVKARKPISITIDAYMAGGGAYVFAGQCESGHSYTVDE